MATINRMTSPHAEEAKLLLDKIRVFRAEIPRLIPEVPEEMRKLTLLAALPDSFLESVSVAVEKFPRLAQAVGIDAVTLRDSIGFALAYRSVVQELRALSRAMAHTIRVERASAGKSALDVYAVAQRLSGQKDGAELLPFVNDMRGKLSKKRKTTSNPVPATDASSPAPSARV